MSDRRRNPMGTPAECAAAACLITPDLVAQANEIRSNFWDFHPHALLPQDRMLVAYPDGVWIADADGASLGDLVKYVRVADSWPVVVAFDGFWMTADVNGQIPIPADHRLECLRLLSVPSGAILAEVSAPAEGWNHDRLRAALEGQRITITAERAIDAFLGPVPLGTAYNRTTQ